MKGFEQMTKQTCCLESYLSFIRLVSLLLNNNEIIAMQGRIMCVVKMIELKMELLLVKKKRF